MKCRALSLIIVLSAIAVSSTFTRPAMAQQNTRDGAAIGGATGAVIGGIIGHQNNETPEGAIIGGVVGAVAGGLMGKAKDNQVARERYYQDQIYQQQQQLAQMQRPCVTVNDVVTMSRNGLSDQVIINYLNTNGVERRLNVSEIIALHQQGVSENVISAMQTARVGQQTNSIAQQPARQPVQYQVIEPQPTIIVRESYPVMPPPVIYQPFPQPRTVFYYQFGGGHHHHR